MSTVCASVPLWWHYGWIKKNLLFISKLVRCPASFRDCDWVSISKWRMPQNCASLWHIQSTNLYETIITIVDLMHNNTQSLFQHSTDIMADTVCIEQWYVCTRATSLSWGFSTDVLKACIHAVLHQYSVSFSKTL